MRLFTSFSVVLLLGLVTGPALPSAAQANHSAHSATFQFAGAVFSDTGLMLPGATVTPEGQIVNIGTANAEGYFVLQLPKGQPVKLVVAAAGHETQIIELQHPEKEKNLVVTLVNTENQASAQRAGRRRRD